MKINRGFVFFLGYMSEEATNFSGDPRYNPTKQTKLLGGFQPLLDMKKDLADTFKPYKSTSYLIRDLAQPMRGLQNIFTGVGYFFLPMIVQPPTDISLPWFLYGVSNFLRGITQILATFLTWALRIPLRVLITYFSGGPPASDFEQRESIISLIATAEQDVNSLLDEGDGPVIAANICLELHRKFESTTKNKKPTKLDKTEEACLFSGIDLINANLGHPYRFMPKKEVIGKYLAFFKPSSVAPREANNSAEVINQETSALGAFIQ